MYSRKKSSNCYLQKRKKKQHRIAIMKCLECDTPILLFAIPPNIEKKKKRDEERDSHLMRVWNVETLHLDCFDEYVNDDA